MKINDDNVFNYNAAYWTDGSTLNPTSLDTGGGNAKLAAFNAIPVRSILGCVDKPLDNCVDHGFATTYASARALFNAGYLAEGVTKDGFERVFQPTGNRDCPKIQQPGFNVVASSGNKARWGYLHNIPSQQCQGTKQEDSDAAIGRPAAVRLNEVHLTCNGSSILRSFRVHS